MTLLPEDERVAYEQRIADLKTEELDHKKNESRISNELVWLQDIEKLSTKKKQLPLDLNELDQIRLSNEDGFRRLGKHNVAVVYKPALAEIRAIAGLAIATETLDTAISALENLQANGKMIGVISHAEALKDRIGTQVRVNKLPGGSSTISISGYNGRVA